MAKKKTTAEFIEQAQKIHNDRYCYSLVEYKNRNHKISIICHVHDIFKQRPFHHLNGQGCPKCNGSIKKTTTDFIKKAQEVHKNKYNYSKAVYKNNNIKIHIICSQHGIFEQRPIFHLRGHGCPQCAYASRTKSQNEFLKQARKIHQSKYNYSVTEYNSAKSYIKIICPVHGLFLQMASAHLRGQGCPFCAGNIKKTTQRFIQQAKIIHKNKYDYSWTNYISAKNKVIIKCKKHGNFKQGAQEHLKGYGCRYCSNVISIAECQWLDYLGIKNRQVSINIKNKLFIVDGFDPKTNTIYEFYGDYWHGNPDKYPSQNFNQSTNCTFGELYQRTIEKENILKSAGYKIISIWEKDMNNKA